MARHKNTDWDLPDKLSDWRQAELATWMDIRDELREIRDRLGVLRCSNFIAIPTKLDQISKNTTRPQRRRKKATR